jgi:hypothetical protein
MKTAVETLFDRIEEIWFIDPAAGQFYEEVISLKEQAKEMEQEQIIESHIEGSYSPPFRKSRKAEAEQYYNETFKSE